MRGVHPTVTVHSNDALAKIEDRIDDLDGMGVHYRVLTDHALDHHEFLTDC
jgi:hypothetical protein